MSKTLNKEDLVAIVSDNTGWTRRGVTSVIDELFSTIGEAVADGTKVRITGQLTIEAVDRAERVGRNPRTGEKITIPAHRSVRVKPGDTLRGYVK